MLYDEYHSSSKCIVALADGRGGGEGRGGRKEGKEGGRGKGEEGRGGKEGGKVNLNLETMQINWS